MDGLTVAIPLTVFVFGCLGGLVNSLLAGEFKLPGLDSTANVYRPGWVGNVLVGGITALVFWALYGRFGEVAVLGATSPSVDIQNGFNINLTISEVAGAIVSGIGGGRLLTNEADKKGLQNQNAVLEQTTNELSNTIENFIE